METVVNQNTKMDGSLKYEEDLNAWIDFEKTAIQFIHVTGQLWFDKTVELMLFRNQLIDKNVSEILNYHNYAKTVANKPITIYDTLMLAKEVLQLDLPPSRIDIGRLAWEWEQEKDNYKNATDFITDKLKDIIGRERNKIVPKDVVLYGFGRVGRLCTRELVSQSGKGEQLRLKAIVTRGNSDDEIIKRASLLRMDSVHGPFPGSIVEDLENKSIIVNGHRIKMIAANNPEEVDYTQYGIKDAFMIDSTGIFRNREGLGKHLKAKGISKVLLTAPGKDDIPNIVYGINQKDFDIDSENIFSTASCTTNAIVPVLFAIENSLGIDKGHIETIHSYTNDQNLLDNYHKKYRRGRSAPLNMVITETGAGKAVAKAIPTLKGKLTANAVRVPTPNVSLAILNLSVKRETSVKEVNAILRDASLQGKLVEQIQYSYSNELVSSDVIGNPCAAVYDSPATIVTGNTIILYVWYDNEFGFTKQTIRLAKFLSKVRRVRYY